MPKYLIFELAVFSGKVIQDKNLITDSDLTLHVFEDNQRCQVLKNGMRVIENIILLSKEGGYRIILPDASSYAIYERLLLACKIKHFTLPPILESVPQLSKNDRSNHIVFADNAKIITDAKRQGFKTYLIGENEGQLTLDEALTQVVQMQPINTVTLQASRQRHQSYQQFYSPLPTETSHASSSHNSSLTTIENEEINQVIQNLESDLKGCFCFNKDRKQREVTALNLLLTQCENSSVAEAIAFVESESPGITQSCCSTAANLLNRLKSDYPERAPTYV